VFACEFFYLHAKVLFFSCSVSITPLAGCHCFATFAHPDHHFALVASLTRFHSSRQCQESSIHRIEPRNDFSVAWSR